MQFEFDQRSPLLMSPAESALLVIDVQEKLVPFIEDHKRVVWNVGRLIDAAQATSVSIVATEQYPRGLGHTVPEIRQSISEFSEKAMFSCRECGEPFQQLASRGRRKILLCGIETHVCVQQTALDLIAADFDVYVGVDAVGARFAIDHETALRRMESSGATLTTTESAMFEWCETSGTPQFKAISNLAKQKIPV